MVSSNIGFHTQGTLIRLWATSNCARIAELRRGIDPAAIFCLSFSPSGRMVACTSDKSTLHIFDVPPRSGTSPPPSTTGRGSSSGVLPSLSSAPGSPRIGGAGNNATAVPPNSPTDDGGRGRWGILGRIPLMPKLFSDVYSFASCPFESGDDPYPGTGGSSGLSGGSGGGVGGGGGGGGVGGVLGMGGGLLASLDPDTEGSMTLGTGRPPKGIIGWVAENSLVVVGAGRDARWEKFNLTVAEDGRRIIMREGWKRYLGAV